MKMLELFSGTAHMSEAFKKAGWDTYRVDYDTSFPAESHADIGKLTAQDILDDFGRPDVIWASPDCTTFSIAAISHHRMRDPETGYLLPVSEYARTCDRIDQHVLRLILALSPRLWFIENPRGGLRKTEWMEGLPRYTVSYCQYGDTRMKPTDIWTNHPRPEFKPLCHNGDPCHQAAPRGSKTGTQGLKNHRKRSEIPTELCDHIAHISQEYLELDNDVRKELDQLAKEVVDA